jgi:hypothetical protein
MKIIDRFRKAFNLLQNLESEPEPASTGPLPTSWNMKFTEFNHWAVLEHGWIPLRENLWVTPMGFVVSVTVNNGVITDARTIIYVEEN